MFVDRRARQSGTRAPGRLTCSKGRHHVVVCGLATPSRELARRKDQAASAPRPPLRLVGWGLVRHRTDEAGPLVDRLEHAPPRRGVGRPEPWELVAPLVREVWAVGCFSGSVVLWFPSRRIPPPMRAQSIRTMSCGMPVPQSAWPRDTTETRQSGTRLAICEAGPHAGEDGVGCWSSAATAQRNRGQ